MYAEYSGVNYNTFHVQMKIRLSVYSIIVYYAQRYKIKFMLIKCLIFCMIICFVECHNTRPLRPKYKEDPKSDNNFRGWLRKGIKIYNDLIDVARRHINTTHNKELKKNIKLCGKSENGNRELSESDESKSESLNAYDDFSGNASI